MTAASASRTAAGGCLCGGVRFTVADPPAQVVVCHCDTCRRLNGGPMMAFHPAGIELEARDTLTWYRSSGWAERGFCSACGASLFYRLVEDPSYVSVAVGAMDDPAMFTAIEKHIFVEEKPAFYDFADAAPRRTGAEVIAAFTAEEHTQ